MLAEKHTINGYYYDGKTSYRYDVSLDFVCDGTIVLTGDQVLKKAAFVEIKISSRIANTPRYLYFADGGKFETTDNAFIDKMSATFMICNKSTFIHRIESKSRIVVLSLLTILLCSFLFYRYVIPYASQKIAFNLPVETNIKVSEKSLEILDNNLFESSTLAHERQENLQAGFDSIIAGIAEDFDFKLLFRKGGRIGANAFALPSGNIIITDELIELSENDDEIISILAHEVGHVVNRHGLRTIINNSAVFFLISFITGDISTGSSLIAAIPTLLVQNKYSRDYEKEADLYSYNYLVKNNIETINFSNIMERLSAKHGAEGEISIISTHPSTEERIRLFKGD